MFKQEKDCYEIVATSEFKGATIRIYQLKNIENKHHRAVVSANVFLEESFDIVNCKAIAVVINEKGDGGAIYIRDRFTGFLKELRKLLPDQDIKAFPGIASNNEKMWKQPFSLTYK